MYGSTMHPAQTFCILMPVLLYYVCVKLNYVVILDNFLSA